MPFEEQLHADSLSEEPWDGYINKVGEFRTLSPTCKIGILVRLGFSNKLLSFIGTGVCTEHTTQIGA
ncbi:unnamed protein product [Cuscuta campestris]|uniref:Uncharacterized protein n=1 Tax=Cuscuta campestris TaxID=132261 RepID=A0A484KS35_9ASTE|nr:unnamed protein product [Cuscuta campestris]